MTDEEEPLDPKRAAHLRRMFEDPDYAREQNAKARARLKAEYGFDVEARIAEARRKAP